MKVISYHIEWQGKGPRDTQYVEQPFLLVTDIGLTAEQLTPLLDRCEGSGGPLVLVCPHIDASIQRLKEQGRIGFVHAIAFPGEPILDLLSDLAVMADASLLSRDVCFTLVHPDGSRPPDRSPGGILLGSFSWEEDVSTGDLGRAEAVEMGKEEIVFTWERTRTRADKLRTRTEHLRRELEHSRDLDEVAGLRRRMMRLGVAPPESVRSPSREQSLERGESFRLSAGYVSPCFLTDPVTLEAVFETPFMLVVDFPLHDYRDIVQAMEFAAAQLRALVVVAPTIRDGVLTTLVANKLRGVIRTAAVEVHSSDDLRRLAELTGATIVQAGNETVLYSPGLRVMLGQANKIVVDRRNTWIWSGSRSR